MKNSILVFYSEDAAGHLCLALSASHPRAFEDALKKLAMVFGYHSLSKRSIDRIFYLIIFFKHQQIK